MNTRAILAAVSVLLPIFLLAPWPSPATFPSFPRYSVTDLGTLPGDDTSFAWGISETGAVVGGSSGPSGMRAFLWTREAGMVPLPCPRARPYCVAHDVNDAGEAAGSAWTSAVDQPGHAIRWTAGAPQDLGVLRLGMQSDAWGINDAGTVVGYSWTGTGWGPHGFVYSDARGMVDVTGGDSPGYLYAISDEGLMAGHRLEGADYHAYLWGDGTSLGLGAVSGFGDTYGRAVNSLGMAAGYVRSSSGNERIIRSTTNGQIDNLGGVYDQNRGYGINRAGDVVGEARSLSGPVRAVLYTDSTGLQDLHLYLDPNLGWFLMAATGINDAGQIAAYGSNLATGRTHAVLLSPPNYTAAPHDLGVAAAGPDTVRLTWAPAADADSYRVYSSADRSAPFPWTIAGTTTGTSFDLPGDLSDGQTHFYLVRAVSQGLEGPNSTMGVKVSRVFTFQEGRTNIAWFSLPYRSSITRASDLAFLIGSGNVDVIGKWDASRQSTAVYYHVGESWRGEDFPLAAGDGLYLGLRASFSLVLLGTDAPVTLSFATNPPPTPNVAWIGVPSTGVYRRASDLAAELGPAKILEAGRWDPSTQTSVRWSWTGEAWAGTDFDIAPGDGVYVVVLSAFSWTPRLVTPALD